MAIYHCSVKLVSRSKGGNSVASSAYRSGEYLIDERTGVEHDYTKKSGIDHIEILLPSHAPEHFTNRSVLWNEVERIEKRKDAQLCREVELAIPRELNNEQKIKLVQDYAQANFVVKGMIADIAIHHIEGDNPHAHILLTTREVTKEGFGQKNRDWNNRELLKDWRQSWAEFANKSLEQNNLKQRIDHRSLKEQGIDREPTIHMGKDAMAMERNGIETEKGNINRQVIKDNLLRQELTQQIKQEQQNEYHTQKLLKMASVGLKEEISKIVPENPKDLAERKIDVLEARKTQYALQEELEQTKQAMSTLSQNYEKWRAENPKRASLHKSGWMTNKHLATMEDKYSELKEKQQRIEPQLAEAKTKADNLAETHRIQITEEQKPQRKLVESLEKLYQQKLTEEREQQKQERERQLQAYKQEEVIKKFKQEASFRHTKIFGYDDDGKFWKRIAPEAREMIDTYNKSSEQQKQQFIEQFKERLKQSPELVEKMEQKISTKEKYRDRGLSL